MNEIEVRPNLFVLPMAREVFQDKLLMAWGEDKQLLLDRANQYSQLGDIICQQVFLINKTALTLFIQENYPTFNPETDYIFVSDGERNSIQISDVRSSGSRSER